MYPIGILGRGTAIVLLLFFSPACAHSKNWVYQEVRERRSESNSASLTLPPANAFNGIELQLLRTPSRTFAYLGVHSRSIPKEAENLVTIIVDDKPYSFSATVMEGGQHLLLSDEATQLLTHSLANKQKVTVAIAGGFVAEIPADQFNKHYRKFSRA